MTWYIYSYQEEALSTVMAADEEGRILDSKADFRFTRGELSFMLSHVLDHCNRGDRIIGNRPACTSIYFPPKVRPPRIRWDLLDLGGVSLCTEESISEHPVFIDYLQNLRTEWDRRLKLYIDIGPGGNGAVFYNGKRRHQEDLRHILNEINHKL